MECYRQNEKDLAVSLLNAAPLMVLLLDMRGYIEYVNPYFEKVSGYSFAKIKGKEWFATFLPQRDKDRIRELFLSAVQDEPVCGNVNPIVTNNGEERQIEWSARALRDADGKITGVLSIGQDVTERIQAEIKLDIKSRRQQQIIDSMFGFLGVCSLDGILLEANDAPIQAAGLKREDVIGQPFSELYWWSFSTEVQDKLRDAMARAAKGETVRYDTPVRIMGGVKVMLDVMFGPLCDTEGRVLEIVGFGVDITERKAAEKELQYFKNTLDKTLDCVFMFDAESLLFTYVNAGAIQQVGFTQKEMLRMHPFDIKPEFSEQQFREMLLPLIAGEKSSLSFETIHQHKSGRTIAVEIALQYIEPENGLAHYISVVRDITERKRTEQMLYTQAKIIDQIHDAVFSTNLEGFVTIWNKGAEALFGYAGNEVIGEKITKLNHEKNNADLWKAISRLKQKGFSEAEVVFTKKGGEPFHAHLSLSMMHDDHGNKTGIVAYAMDITERKLMESELESYRHVLEAEVDKRTGELVAARDEAERANISKSEFLSRMSHELRTPMNAILGFGQILQLDSKEFTDVQRSNVEEILEAGDHLLKLINGVLDLAKVESGKVDILLENIAVSDLLRRCINLIEPQANNKKITIIDNISRYGFDVHADFTRLKQVLLNLLSNAVKYNHEHGTVTLDSEIINKKNLRITVSDTGSGIAVQDMTRLFTSFERLDSSNVTEGAGIGLVISKQLIELMGGAIGVESTRGEGASFWVEIALSEDSQK